MAGNYSVNWRQMVIFLFACVFIVGVLRGIFKNTHLISSYDLHPEPIAVENRETIGNLLAESLKRLALAIEGGDAKQLWENVDAIMSDSASKNWNVGEVVARILNSQHIPMMLFCNAHYTLRLDEGNLKVLLECESRLGLADMLVKIHENWFLCCTSCS